MKRILLIILIFCAVKSNFAAHIIGGSISYECVGNDTYEFTMTIYRDCNGGGADCDDPADISIFDTLQNLITNPAIPQVGDTIIPENDLGPCANNVPNRCVQECSYVWTEFFPNGIPAGGLDIMYQRCCRNASIDNIVDPGGTGATYVTHIPDPGVDVCNSSPAFNNFPPILICIDQAIDLDFSATDLDGDSLVYNLCTPYDGGSPANPNPGLAILPLDTIDWLNPPYNAQDPIGGFPTLTIDPNTGQLVGYPDMVGQYVVGVCVEEYDPVTGVLISTVLRDFQFNVVDCQLEVLTDIQSNYNPLGENCAPLTINFLNVTPYSTVNSWTFEGLDNPYYNEVTNIDNNVVTLTFDDPGNYYVTLYAQDTLTCVIIDSSFYAFKVNQCIFCPDSFAYDVNENYCDNDSLAFDFTLWYTDTLFVQNLVDENGIDTLAEITFTYENNIYTLDDTIPLINTDCEPKVREIIFSIVCIDDPSEILMDTISINVFPTDISSFVSSTVIEEIGDCQAFLTVDPNCVDYISIPPAPILNEGDNGNATFTVNYLPSDSCSPPYDIVLPYDCPDCEISNLQLDILACDGIQYDVLLDFDVQDGNTAFSIDGLGTFNYADLPLQFGPYDGLFNSTYEFLITDSLDATCTNSVEFGPVVCAFCDLDSLQLTGICNGEDSLTFDIYASFVGDNQYTIYDTDGNVYSTNSTSGDNVYIGAFPNLAEVTIIVEDNFVPNCQTAAFIECVICDESSCFSQEGTISANEINPCFGELVIADADDFLLMPKQSVWYLIHNMPNVSASNLPDFGTDVYATGSFLNNDNGTIPCGTTAYITAFGAQEDPNNPGYPNYNDICMTISNTLPINLLCAIGISTDEICNVVTGQFTYSFIITGGMPPFSGENYYVSGNYFTGVVGLSELVSVGPIADGETYIINVIDSEGCTNSFEATIQCEKLPVELISFEGKQTANGNLIKWQTATEEENDYFTILKSNDGITFESIGNIEGAGNSTTTKSYELLDNRVDSEITYYRLKATDFNGNSGRSDVIVVNGNGKTDFVGINSIIPQPVEDEAIVSITSSKQQEANMQLYSLKGAQIHNQNITLNIGNNNVNLSVKEFKAGIYILKIVTETAVLSHKVLVD